MTNEEKISRVNSLMKDVIDNFDGGIGSLYGAIRTEVKKLDSELGGLIPSLSYSKTLLPDVLWIRLAREDFEMVEIIPWLYPRTVGKELCLYGRMKEGMTTNNMVGYMKFTRRRLPEIGFLKEIWGTNPLGIYDYKNDRFQRFF